MKNERLGNFCSVRNGYAFNSSDFTASGVPVIRISNLIDNGDVDLDKAKRIEFNKDLEKFKIVKGDILIAMSGATTGKLARYNSEEFALQNQRVGCFIVDENRLNADYLLYALATLKKKIGKKAIGGAQPNISAIDIEDLEISIPSSLSDQIRIATVLSKAEFLIKQRKENINSLDEFLNSSFLKMFGDPVSNEKEWQEKKLGLYITDIVSGSSYGGEVKDFLEETELGVLKVSAVTGGTFNPREFKAVRKELINKKIVHPKIGDLLFTRANTRELVGATCIVQDDYPDLFLPDKIWKLIVDENNLDKYFIHFLLQHKRFKLRLTNEATGSSGSMLNISMEKLRQLQCPIPPIDLQKQFALIVEKTELLKTKSKQSLSGLEDLYASLSQRAFRGELDLSAIKIDQDLLIKDAKKAAVLSIPSSLQEAIVLADKISKQFKSIDRINKVSAGITKQLEQWDKLQKQFKSIPQLPESLIYAQKKVARIQDAINKAESAVHNSPTGKQDWKSTSFTNIARQVREHFWNKILNRSYYFNSEMLYNHLKQKFGETITYFTTKELLMKPSLQESETFKAFVENAINDERFPIRFEQVFYNAEKENFNLDLTEIDLELLEKESKNMQSGIYFKIK